MGWWLAGIGTAALLLQFTALTFQRRDIHFEKSAMGMQAFATTVAIMLAGYWYVYERKGVPHANTKLEVVGLKVSRDHVDLETRFSISNLGATLLNVGEADVRLQEVNRDSLPLQAIEALEREEFPDKLLGGDVYDDGILMWPTVKWFRGGAPRHIEPGETDLRVVDFIASCRNTAMRVMFMMKRPGTDQVWSDQALINLAGLCSKKIGSREVLSVRSSD